MCARHPTGVSKYRLTAMPPRTPARQAPASGRFVWSSLQAREDIRNACNVQQHEDHQQEQHRFQQTFTSGQLINLCRQGTQLGRAEAGDPRLCIGHVNATGDQLRLDFRPVEERRYGRALLLHLNFMQQLLCRYHVRSRCGQNCRLRKHPKYKYQKGHPYRICFASRCFHFISPSRLYAPGSVDTDSINLQLPHRCQMPVEAQPIKSAAVVSPGQGPHNDHNNNSSEGLTMSMSDQERLTPHSRGALRSLCRHLLPLGLLSSVTLAHADPVALTDVRIFDGTGAAAIEQGVILIEDGRIQAVGAMNAIEIPADAQRYDLSGKTITPGFINAHGHAGDINGLESGHYSEANLLRQLGLYARYGVTTVLSLGDDETEGFEIRDRQDRTDLERARLYVAGPVLAPRTPADAARMVDET